MTLICLECDSEDFEIIENYPIEQKLSDGFEFIVNTPVMRCRECGKVYVSFKQAKDLFRNGDAKLKELGYERKQT